VDAPLDAELFEGLGKAKAGEDDADGADDGAGVGDDLVAGGGDEIAARGRGILDEDDDVLVVLGREVANTLGNQPRLHRRAAGRIDDDGHGVAGHLEGAMEERGHGLDIDAAGALVGGDDAVQAHDRDHRSAAAERPGDEANKSGRFRHQSKVQNGGDVRPEAADYQCRRSSPRKMASNWGRN
jgi:hypothetical protein